MPGMDATAEYGAVGKLKLPALLIWGREDKTVSAADIQQIEELIPGIEYHTIEEAGHIPQYERPEVVNPLLINFLNGLKNPLGP